MSERHKPGVGRWAAIVILAAMAYPVSFGPVCWLASRHRIPIELQSPVYWSYRPMTCFVLREQQHPVAHALGWWADVGADGRPGGVFSLWGMVVEEE